MKKLSQVTPVDLGKKFRVYPDNPKYEGVRIRYSGQVDGRSNTVVPGTVDGTFLITYHAAGKLKWETIGKVSEGWTPKAVRLERIERIREVKKKGFKPRRVPTMADAFEIWLNWAANNNKEYATAVSRYNNHIKPYLGRYRLDRISPEMLEDLKGKWSEAGLSASSQQQLYLLISRVYNRLRRLKKYTGYNPYTDVEKINAKRKRQRFLTYDQLQQLLKALKEDHMVTYLQAMLATYCGLRKEEVLRLSPSDIDLDNRVLRIKTKHKTKRWKIRTQPYPERLVPIIHLMMAEHEGGPTDSFYPFLNYRRFNKAVNKFGWNNGLDPLKDRVKRVCFHTLRHSYACHLLKKGADIKKVQSVMGHDSLSSTMVYLHANDDDKRETVELMNGD